MRFGRLIGAGQAGFVFQNMDNPKHFYKLVALPDNPLSSYPIRSLDRKLFAVNSQQAVLFQRLAESGNQPSALPKVYSFVQGTIDPSLRRQLITSSEDFGWEDELTDLLREFRTGQPYAVWEMEAIPCTDANDYCQRFDKNKLSPLDNSDYQVLLKWLLSQGFVVRDIRNPENFGFREDGSQVFFDPVVAPWPVEDSDPESRAAFTGTFGNDLVTVQRALDSGDYFNWYHGQAIMQSEEVGSLDPIMTFKQLQKFWNDNNLYPGDDNNFEQLIQWESLYFDISKHPESLNSINWTGNNEQTVTELRKATNTILKQIWGQFTETWNEEFHEDFYSSQHSTPIFDVVQRSFHIDEVVTPQTTMLFRIVNDANARQELLDNEHICDIFIDEVWREQLLFRKLLLDYGKGNPNLITKAFYGWVRKYCGHQYWSATDKIVDNLGNEWTTRTMDSGTPQERKIVYLRDFSSPYDLIDYENLYDTSNSREMALATLQDGVAPYLTWTVFTTPSLSYGSAVLGHS